jgi:hypothetical protein
MLLLSLLSLLSISFAATCDVSAVGCRADGDDWKSSDTCSAVSGAAFFAKTIFFEVPETGAFSLTVMAVGSLADGNALSLAYSAAGSPQANASCPNPGDATTFPAGADAVQGASDTALTVTWDEGDLDDVLDDSRILYVTVVGTQANKFAFRQCTDLVSGHCAIPCTDDGSLCKAASCDLTSKDCVCFATDPMSNEPYSYPSCKAASASDEDGDDGDGLGGGAIAIIVVVVVLCLIIVIAVVAVTAYGGTICGINAAGGSGSGSQTIVVNTGGGGGQQGAGYGYGAQEGGAVAYPPAAGGGGGGGGGGAYPPQSATSPYPPTAGGGGYADSDGPPP